ncbi:NUDIX domain-containing protein [Oceanihabitans sp. 2_MG-2023]|uniref:NUDIX hydrolase n=1 Tax=Oceanihabitans sp. 2_MG-2023 TaxID=3062661 RepID=UPI0026E4687A|nr:NUDIX domain-containing protein [Oceanihabitans sp. 2_MG-2023]MDO6597473.1 NUDIX domain-containing protein [Oceanihabitans sp. 2_MG-2023]
MQDEQIDIVSKTGEATGKSVAKSIIHQKGYYHNTAHIWFYTPKGEILLAQRAASKVICPLLWDVSVAGHVDAGETIEQAAIREIQEEIGLSISKKGLQKIGVFKCFQTYENGIIDNEFHHTFLAGLNVNISALKFQKEEVEGLKLVHITEFNELLKHSKSNNHFVASNKAYYTKIIAEILKRIP